MVVGEGLSASKAESMFTQYRWCRVSCEFVLLFEYHSNLFNTIDDTEQKALLALHGTPAEEYKLFKALL